MLKKIIFMGTPYFAVPILKSLYQNGYPVTVVYTQPPQKSNRGQKVNKSPVQLLAETLNIELRTPNYLKNNIEEEKFLKELNADLAIVVAYGQIIPTNLLNITKKGFINIHASLLPKWRGAAPIQRSIMNSDKETGITIMKISDKLDSGPVCSSYAIEILKNENTENLSSRLSKLAAEKISENIDNIIENKAEFKLQDHSKATYAKKILKEEGKIDWAETAENIIGKVNGLSPKPGAWFTYKSERYKILKAQLIETNDEPGHILNDNLIIGCGKESIQILEIQREGKRVQKVKEFVIGSKLKKGSRLKNE